MFTKQELKNIRERAKRYPKIFEKIINETEEIRNHLVIPDKAYSTWGHYFVCPKHSVKLAYDHYDNKNFVCPIDGEVFTGEPYEGGWWTANNYRNSGSCRSLAISYIATGNEELLPTVRNILLGYAKSFKNFEVHGDIPYNKPGRMNSQALCDSAQIYDYIFAYALTKDSFTKSEQEIIEKDFFVPATEHIMNSITHQIHNHEVAICCTVGSVGVVLGKKDFCEFAVNQKYGLKYQLDNALLSDGMWFEGSTCYHFYALKWFLSFEKLARYTEYSLTSDPHYAKLLHKMLIFPFNLRKTDNSMPALNDGHPGECLEKYVNHYEFAYSIFKDPRLAEVIRNEIISRGADAPRFNQVDCLLFGTEELPKAENTIPINYTDIQGSGLAVLHGSDDRYLLLKASPYGGEHDHYDRLSLHFEAYGKNISHDLGTAGGYGAPMHYGYYKNTATHNTVCINGENIAPCKIRPLRYEKLSEGKGNLTYILDAETLPPDDYVMPDMFTIKEWGDETYRGSSMRRIVLWRDKYFIDIFKLSAQNNLRKEWIWHTVGKIALPDGASSINTVSSEKPQSHLKNAYSYTGEGVIKLTHDCGDEIHLDIHALTDGKEMILAVGDNNPATSELAFTIERTYEKEPIYVNVIEAYREGESVINHVEATVTGTKVSVTVYEKNGTDYRFETEI